MKVGILGITRGADFAPIFEDNPHTELSAICDFNKDAVNQFLAGRKDIYVHSEDEVMMQVF